MRFQRITFFFCVTGPQDGRPPPSGRAGLHIQAPSRQATLLSSQSGFYQLTETYNPQVSTLWKTILEESQLLYNYLHWETTGLANPGKFLGKIGPKQGSSVRTPKKPEASSLFQILTAVFHLTRLDNEFVNGMNQLKNLQKLYLEIESYIGPAPLITLPKLHTLILTSDNFGRIPCNGLLSESPLDTLGTFQII